GASMEDTLAFGDAENDMQMVEKCGIGVAMGNAENDLKEVADYVTTDVNQDGMLKAFEHFGLIYNETLFSGSFFRRTNLFDERVRGLIIDPPYFAGEVYTMLKNACALVMKCIT